MISKFNQHSPKDPYRGKDLKRKSLLSLHRIIVQPAPLTGILASGTCFLAQVQAWAYLVLIKEEPESDRSKKRKDIWNSKYLTSDILL